MRCFTCRQREIIINDMATLNLDSRKIDLFARLPFAFALDHLIGPAWKHVPWPTLPDFESLYDKSSPASATNSTRTPSAEEMSSVLAGILRAVCWRCLMAIGNKVMEPYFAHSLYFNLDFLPFLCLDVCLYSGATLCWMVIRFFPSTQMILVAIWVEAACMLPVVVILTIASVEYPVHYALLAVVGAHIASWNMLNNLRQLRLLELMSLPPAQAEQYSGINVRQIGNNWWLYLWPKISLMIVAHRMFYDPSEIFSQVVKFTAIAASFPAVVLIVEGLRWRMWNTAYVLRGRNNGEVRISMISANYWSIDNFMWVSVNEEMVNNVYSLVFVGHLVHSLMPTAYQQGMSAVGGAFPAALVESTTASWISLFGLCWISAGIYHRVLTTWFRSMQIGFSPAQERDHASLRFELAGCFYLFLWLANVLDMDRPLTPSHVFRLMLFFVLFKLSTVPYVSSQVAQTQALEGTGTGLHYAKYVVEGSLVPASLGILLFDRCEN